MGKIALLHTTSATVGVLGPLLRARCPAAVLENFVDDSILPMLRQDPSTLGYAYEKLLAYSLFAQRQQALLVLSVCSSVGGFKQAAQGLLDIPVVRIDDAVSDLAVAQGKPIVVLATLETTLSPSVELLRQKGAGRIDVQSRLVAGAFEALQAGDTDTHDGMIRTAAQQALEQDNLVYLAQASMARATQTLPDALRGRVLSSTGPAVEAVGQLYDKLTAGGKAAHG